MNDPIEATQEALKRSTKTSERPFVCLSYAQSLDGSITAHAGHPTPISGPESLRMTHQLRCLHDCILIGINTALADDPQLNVRLVEGVDPDPVVLDSELRLPPSSRLLTTSRTAHIFCSEPFNDEHANKLSDAGASIHPVTKTDQGLLDLQAILPELYTLGYRALMVEGGARVITEFLRVRSVDWLVLTVAPILLGGLRVPIANHALHIWSPVELDLRGTAHCGQDLVVWGKPSWQVE